MIGNNIILFFSRRGFWRIYEEKQKQKKKLFPAKLDVRGKLLIIL